ncbi:hypothetical protein AHiyo8_59050 [Arthrobacter sp. Hiyo8]|uniref:hypothetical protein n=1 Tax=Arthrobacter sp. Hiyo1 TaxID=1588020 RepID=UPI000683A966|nr:hypothetical protein [Arthrobacter sp. Hiyo1]BAS17602.1 hypothetical protein AHiyo8_59050 [Arthrobacter sp. Hiyo8]
MQGQSTIIRKHWFGLAVILAAGLAVELALVLAVAVTFHQGQLTPNVYAFLGVIMVVVLLADLVTTYVYRLSSIVLTDAGITITNWQTLFFSNTAECEWNQVEDVNAKQGGVFAQLLGFGTLLIQTAGTQNNITMMMVPRAQYWRATIEAKAAATPTLTHSV